MRGDANCTIHTHQPIASALALLGNELSVTDPQLRRLLGASIPIAGYAPSGTNWLVNKVAKTLRPDSNAYLMLNHGVLCCGRDAQTAAQTVAALEALAAQQLQQRILSRAQEDLTHRRLLRRMAHALTASCVAPGTGPQREDLRC